MLQDKDTAQLLEKYISSIENYEAEKKEISERVKEVYDEAKVNGFDVKTIKKIIKIRSTSPDKLREEQALLETYANAIQLELF